MGIPFFIYGNKQIFINNRDPNITKGLYDPYAEFEFIRLVHDMFSGLFTKISPAQKEYVETTLGLKDGLSRGKMAWVLYSSFLKWIFSGTGIKFACNILGKWLKKKSNK